MWECGFCHSQFETLDEIVAHVLEEHPDHVDEGYETGSDEEE